MEWQARERRRRPGPTPRPRPSQLRGVERHLRPRQPAVVRGVALRQELCLLRWATSFRLSADRHHWYISDSHHHQVEVNTPILLFELATPHHCRGRTREGPLSSGPRRKSVVFSQPQGRKRERMPHPGIRWASSPWCVHGEWPPTRATLQTATAALFYLNESDGDGATRCRGRGSGAASAAGEGAHHHHDDSPAPPHLETLNLNSMMSPSLTT
mmetsp:Transcript_2325/g.5999  ORF Transcript_2325/g.5999 Transcript_2325/m.5999 type:complete len:213 (-) Transcript_2325:176-814(-)